MSNLKFKPLINTIFVHIPKTAGMSLFDSVLQLDKFFSWFLGLNKSIEDEQLNKFDHLKTISLGHLSYKSLLDSNLMDIKYFKRGFKFCFVRNPYDRLVSLYNYHRIEKRLGYDFDTFVKLLYEEFKAKKVPPIGLYNVKTFNKDSPLYHYQIYGNQYNQMTKWIPPDIGFIGRFENLESDINQVLCILGYTGPLVNIPKLNSSKKEKQSYKDYYKSEQTIKYVKAIYKKDINRFGYKL